MVYNPWGDYDNVLLFPAKRRCEKKRTKETPNVKIFKPPRTATPNIDYFYYTEVKKEQK